MEQYEKVMSSCQITGAACTHLQDSAFVYATSSFNVQVDLLLIYLYKIDP